VNITYHVLKRFQKIVEAIYYHPEGEMDFLTFQETSEKILNQSGKDIFAQL